MKEIKGTTVITSLNDLTNLTKNKLNWDNEFSVRINLDNKGILQYIPSNIFSLELPELSTNDILDDTVQGMLKLTLRSTVDGSVEKEVFDTLFNTAFDIDVSLSNPNRITWQFVKCGIEKITFAPLINRKSKSNPFNFTLLIKPTKIVYNSVDKVIEFGETPTEYISEKEIAAAKELAKIQKDKEKDGE